MSRSYRKTPVHGNCVCSSEKKDKQLNHRRERQAVRQALHHDKEVMPDYREVSNRWTMGKDGKQWFGDSLRQLKAWALELMRK